jgi:Flp pilus assembly protein TadG
MSALPHSSGKRTRKLAFPLPMQRRKGAVAAMTAILLVFVLGMVAFTVDVSAIGLAKLQLQSAADSAALAGAATLVDALKSQSVDGSLSNAALNRIRQESIKFSELHRCAGDSVKLASGDIAIGYLSDPLNRTSTFETGVGRYNTVQVNVKRTKQDNGALNLFFAPIFGHSTIGLEATATASCISNVRGFQTNSKAANSKLLPFTLHIDKWNAVLTGTGPDVWSHDPAEQKVFASGDGTKEVILYGRSKIVAGNFGTVDIGSSGNGTNDIVRQILHGPNQSDFDHHGGKLELGSDGTLILNGDTGLSVGFKSALTSIIGQSRIIPLYDRVSGVGNRANYRIVGFAGIVITEVMLTGGKKQVVIQPAPCHDPTAIFGGESVSESLVYSVGLTR